MKIAKSFLLMATAFAVISYCLTDENTNMKQALDHSLTAACLKFSFAAVKSNMNPFIFRDHQIRSHRRQMEVKAMLMLLMMMIIASHKKLHNCTNLVLWALYDRIRCCSVSGLPQFPCREMNHQAPISKPQKSTNNQAPTEYLIGA